MVEIAHAFDRAQDMIQAKRRSVMPAPDRSRGQDPAGIQGGEGVTNTENLDSRFRGKDGRGSQIRVDIIGSPRLRAEDCLILRRAAGLG